MGPSWDKANHAAIGRITSCQHGEIVGHVHRHFRILFVDSGFIGGGGGGGLESIFLLGDENGF